MCQRLSRVCGRSSEWHVHLMCALRQTRSRQVGVVGRRVRCWLPRELPVTESRGKDSGGVVRVVMEGEGSFSCVFGRACRNPATLGVRTRLDLVAHAGSVDAGCAAAAPKVLKGGMCLGMGGKDTVPVRGRAAYHVLRLHSPLHITQCFWCKWSRFAVKLPDGLDGVPKNALWRRNAANEARLGVKGLCDGLTQPCHEEAWLTLTHLRGSGRGNFCRRSCSLSWPLILIAPVSTRDWSRMYRCRSTHGTCKARGR